MILLIMLATVIYMTISDDTSIDFAYVPDRLNVRTAAYLRGIAREAVLAWQRGENT